ncbi:hypothetical protein GR925_15945 [Streptomyces sp. HUCO-GS316]|uniref:hypothetical protein n=1 Tax=Streptomyces sp. HUCO-GS316 TaxID=2692198 RepID=UPI00136BCA41|nr:hypothetical protein [Streptomyces sp. HUCO-GS316]MXM64898.1 hypothetical protein [Streptomyces sp. HUCO-GS316]
MTMTAAALAEPLTGAKASSQHTTAVPGTTDSLDFLGSAVQLRDSAGNGRAELVASAVNENTGDGAVWLFESTTSGITTRGSTSFTGTALGGPCGRRAVRRSTRGLTTGGPTGSWACSCA